MESLLTLAGPPSATAMAYLLRRGISQEVVRTCRMTDVKDYGQLQERLLALHNVADLRACGLL